MNKANQNHTVAPLGACCLHSQVSPERSNSGESDCPSGGRFVVGDGLQSLGVPSTPDYHLSRAGANKLRVTSQRYLAPGVVLDYECNTSYSRESAASSGGQLSRGAVHIVEPNVDDAPVFSNAPGEACLPFSMSDRRSQPLVLGSQIMDELFDAVLSPIAAATSGPPIDPD